MRDRLLFWSKCLVICVVQRIMYPGTVRQTQWLDPFNGDRRCDRCLREEKNAKKVGNFHFLCLYKSREFIQRVKKHYCALFWRVTVYRVARKKKFCKTYSLRHSRFQSRHATACGKERCVTTLKTAVQQTIKRMDLLTFCAKLYNLTVRSVQTHKSL